MKLRKSNLINAKTGQPIYLPEYEKGEPEYEEQERVRQMGRDAAENLIKALSDPTGLTPI